MRINFYSSLGHCFEDQSEMIQLKFQKVIHGDSVKQRWQRRESGSTAAVSATDDRNRNLNSGKNRTDDPDIKAISETVSHHLNAHMRAERSHFYTRVAKAGDPEGGGPERGYPIKGL